MINPPQRDETPTLVYNPDTEDFTFKRAIEGTRDQVEYILRSQEITTLPFYIARQGANSLADKLVWKRGIKTNYELEKKNVLEEIYVKD